MTDGEDEEDNMEIADDDDRFMRLLSSEIDKVTAFYVAKARLHVLLCHRQHPNANNTRGEVGGSTRTINLKGPLHFSLSSSITQDQQLGEVGV
jgi:hypothetical protein